MPAVPPPTDRADGALAPVAEPTGRWAMRHRYALLATTVTVLVGVQTLNRQWSTDMWEHVAVVRELIAHPFDPSHPQVVADAPHPSFSPYTVLLGLLGHAFGAEAVTVLSVAAVVNVVLLLVALRHLVLEITANGRAPFWALLFVLALWGFSPYRYSGFFDLNSIGFVAPYPSTFATAAGFATLVAALRFTRERRARQLAFVVIGTLLVVLVHPLSAPWLGLGLGAVVLHARPDRRTLLRLVAAGGLAFGLCLLWPYFPLLDLVRDSPSLGDLNRSMYTDVVARLFPALLGLAVILRRWRADHRDLLALLLAGPVALYVAGAVTGNSSYGRSLAFVVVVLHVALADGVGRLEAAPRTGHGRAWWLGAGALAGLLVLGLVTTSGGWIRMVPEPLLPASTRESDALVRPDEQYAFLADVVGPEEVVVGTSQADGRIIPAIAGRTLVAVQPGHRTDATDDAVVARPFVEDADDRQRAHRAYLDPALDTAARQAIEDRYAIRFVLLHRGSDRDADLYGVLRGSGATVAYEDATFVLVEL